MGNLLSTDIVNDNMESTVFYHSNFRGNWRRTLERDPSGEDTSDWIDYNGNRKVFLCEDIKDVLRQMDTHPDDRDKNRIVFENYIDSFPQISLDSMPAPFTWYNKTIKCINLRPGRHGGSNRLPSPIRMTGQNSHAIVAGRTGSGKSVFLNNLILNMMVEYPPWELELYLADFKKVEMSRYVNTENKAPHVRACAATSEIDYVQSLIQYIKEKKDDREKLFARLGYLNIEEFRKAYLKKDYEVVMPRILFIVDEFQQLFLDANTFQKSIIDDLITDITRKGRSQGVHLMFASQDMSGALNQKQLSNFKVRFALACEAGISSDVLGNSGATTLKTGQVIANTKSKEIEDNDIYSVPIAEDSPERKRDFSDEYFLRLLKEFKDYADQFGYIYLKTQKFYDEDKQMDLDDLVNLLDSPKIKNVRMFYGEDEEIISDSKKYFMSLVLGRKVIYSKDNFDIESLYINYSKNRCLLCLSGDSFDLAYFQKLVAVNIETMNISRDEDSINRQNRAFSIPFFYDLNPLVSSLYSENARLIDMGYLDQNVDKHNESELNELIENKFHFYYRADELEVLNETFCFRKLLIRLLRDASLKNAKDICYAYIKYYLDETGIKDIEEQERLIDNLTVAGFFRLFDDDSNILDFMKNLDFLGNTFQNDIREVLSLYYRYKILKIRPTYKIFAPTIVWITGIENLDRLPSWFPEFASNGMDYNFMTMFFSTASVKYDIKQASNYVFVAGSDPKLYDDYLGKKPAKGDNGIKFHCLIKNTNQRFSFKKYRWQSNILDNKSIDFDSLLE